MGLTSKAFKDEVKFTGRVAGIPYTPEPDAVAVIDGSTGKKAVQTNGVTLITGSTGIADLTLAAPLRG